MTNPKNPIWKSENPVRKSKNPVLKSSLGNLCNQVQPVCCNSGTEWLSGVVPTGKGESPSVKLGGSALPDPPNDQKKIDGYYIFQLFSGDYIFGGAITICKRSPSKGTMTGLLKTGLLRKLLEHFCAKTSCSKLLISARRQAEPSSFEQLVFAQKCSSSFLKRPVFKRPVIVP